MKEQFVSFTVEVLVALIGLGCAYLTLYLRQAATRVKAETEHIRDQRQAELVRQAVDRLNDVAAKTVQKFEQTVAGDLRNKVKAGEVDRSQLLDLGKQAYDEVLKTIEPDVRQVLESTLGDFETYVKNTIETQVHQVKPYAISSVSLSNG